jgi:hypothetical protein
MNLEELEVEKQAIKQKVDAGELTAEAGLEALKEIEEKILVLTKEAQTEELRAFVENSKKSIKATAAEVEQRMLSVNIQTTPKKETRAVDAIKKAYSEKRDITIGTPELGRYDVVNEIFQEIKKATPLLEKVRTYTVPTANMVFPIMSSLSGIQVPSADISYNNPKTKGTKDPVN